LKRDIIKIKRALISVSDKTGIVEFARNLQQWNVEIISTGGTLKTLSEAGISAVPVSDVTGFPEILDGRVKTLHPKIHGGLLAVSDNPEHRSQLIKYGILPIDLLVVNLYPFEQTITRKDVSTEDAVEQIDIGGPAMLRAASKNFKYKTVAVNPSRYQDIISEIEETGGCVGGDLRFTLAKEAFSHTARYDSMIAGYLASLAGDASSEVLPDLFTVSLPKAFDLRYGENPHQQASLYGDFQKYFEKLHGKELSYNNIVDVQSAAELVQEFSEPTLAIIKHTNPCGVGSAQTLGDAYNKAVSTDSKSAFGGVIAVNRKLDMPAAQLIDKIFTEVIIAPEFPGDVLEFLKRKKDRRLIKQLSPLSSQNALAIKQVAGGLLVQTADTVDLVAENLKVVTKRAPAAEEYAGMIFGWRVAKHVKSNAIVYARGDRTIGIGAGQMSRFDSSHIAVMKAKEAALDIRGTAVASDAFFPFADGLLEAVRAGATAVIQPGGSVRDAEVINAADENNIAMVFTGIRHFRH